MPMYTRVTMVAMIRTKTGMRTSGTITPRCGLMAVPAVNLTHEGFGRALITVGKLVVMDRALHDVHRSATPISAR